MQFVDFLKDRDDGITPVEGQRTMIDPDISLPLVASYGHIKPEVRINNMLYNLQNVRQATPQTSFPDTRVTRTVPIYDIDGALTFECGVTYDDKSYKQTLTPRLFYLYIPYVNQNNIPVFDSSVINFDYNQLFAINRFSGFVLVTPTSSLMLSIAASTTTMVVIFSTVATGKSFISKIGVCRYSDLPAALIMKTLITIAHIQTFRPCSITILISAG